MNKLEYQFSDLLDIEVKLIYAIRHLQPQEKIEINYVNHSTLGWKITKGESCEYVYDSLTNNQST